MFNLQGSEIIIVLLLALVVLGPEKLPDAMRKLGQFYAELKKMSSGFQDEFRAAVDEPMRELRDTANTLRDSADFTKLQEGERSEKPKSAEMAAAGDPEPGAVPDAPSFESTDGTESAVPEPADDSKPAPFTGMSSAAPRPGPAAMPTPPPPFASMSADDAAPGDDASHDPDDEVPAGDDVDRDAANGDDAHAGVETVDPSDAPEADGDGSRGDRADDAELEPAPSDDPATR